MTLRKEPSYMLFYEELPASDTPPAPPADTPPASDPEPPAADPDKPSDEPDDIGDEGGDTPADGDDKMDKPAIRKRLAVEGKARKDAEKRAEEAEAKLAELTASKNKPEPDAEPDDGEPELDPTAQKAIDRYMAKQGYVTKAQLEEESQKAEIRKQVDQDVIELSGKAKKAGLPDFDRKAVAEHASKIGMTLGSKDAMWLAYEHLNQEAVNEQRKKAYLAEAQDGPAAEAERPGGGAGSPDAGNTKEGKSMDDMIHNTLKSIHAGK